MGADPPEISICYEQKYLFEAYTRPKKGAENTKQKSKMSKGLKVLLSYIITILSNYVLHCFWLVLVVVCTTMFLFVEVFLVSLHGD